MDDYWESDWEFVWARGALYVGKTSLRLGLWLLVHVLNRRYRRCLPACHGSSKITVNLSLQASRTLWCGDPAWNGIG